MTDTHVVKKAAALILFLFIGMAAGAPRSTGQDQRKSRGGQTRNKSEGTPSLPEGAGRSLVLAACVKCHDLRIVVSQRLTASDWRRTINEMIRLGTQLRADESETVIKYLTTWFGPEDVVPPTAGRNRPGAEDERRGDRPLPEGEGRNLVLQACVQCHDVGIIMGQRKAVSGWRRTVNQMIWRGAPLMADEAETLVQYLAASLGPETATPSLRK